MTETALLVRLTGYLPMLARGAATTFWISFLAILLGFALGTSLLGLTATRRRFSLISQVASLYLSFFRGTPLLVQLLMLFFLPTVAGVELPPLLAAILALGLNSAAFQCEILRAGLAAIPPGQIEAARCFGFNDRKIFRWILLPQIARAVWPALTSEAIDVVKGSAIVSVIAVTDLSRAGRQLASSSFRPLEVFLLVGVVYLALTTLILLLSRCGPRRSTRSRQNERAS
ncbi:ABC transporter permease [Betaproteobacteria bacterium]|nr:ABC transporter permease [Betaproteobacteria bacterium]